MASEPTPIAGRRDLEAVHLADLIEERRNLRQRLADVDAQIDVMMARRTAPKPSQGQRGQMAYRLPKVAELLDVSTAVVKREIAAGNLPSSLIGGCRVVLAGEIDRYLERLPAVRGED